mgnify:CR=1 FL=1
MNPCHAALDTLLIRYINLFKDQTTKLPSVTFESPWPSPCSANTPEHQDKPQKSYWKPIERNELNLFSDLEKALEINFHPDIKTFYGSFWSNGVCVEREDINFSLIQIWNEEDETHLKENLLGHAFAKIKARLPLTFFIGCTYGDEIICLDQETGKIVLEKPGRLSHKTLSPSLESFLISLNPTTDPYEA